MNPRRKRPVVVDARDIARQMREKFADRPVEYETKLPFTWPAVMQNVGDSLAVAYASDKWKPVKGGAREIELYKHLAESRNQVLCVPKFLCDEDRRLWPVVGPFVDLTTVEMPKHFAILGLFEEIHLKLYEYEEDGEVYFSGDDDDGVVCVQVRHGMLGGSIVDGAPFLFVYTESDGVLMLITGEHLGVEKDGIVG